MATLSRLFHKLKRCAVIATAGIVAAAVSPQAAMWAGDVQAGKGATVCPQRASGGQSNRAYQLAETRLIEGDPADLVILAPTSSRRDGRRVVNRWNLLLYKRSQLKLECVYGAHRIVRHVELPPDATMCEGSGVVAAGGAVKLPMIIKCQ
jgi:hypothetical protein